MAEKIVRVNMTTLTGTFEDYQTRHFVQQVMANFWLYRARMGQDSPSLREVVLGRWPTYEVQDRRQLAANAGY